jgi:hypothetical protein
MNAAMRSIGTSSALVFVGLFGGCLASSSGSSMYTYTPTTRTVVAHKPADCVFDLLTLPPSRPFFEVGIVERVGLAKARTASDFTSVIGADVCYAGGDAVLAERNDWGYVRGTVLVYRDGRDGPEPSPRVAAAPAAPAAPPPPPAPAGKTTVSVMTPSAELRTAPFQVAPLVTTLPRGQRIVVGQSNGGWRLATLPDGRVGYVRDEQIEEGASSPR